MKLDFVSDSSLMVRLEEPVSAKTSAKIAALFRWLKAELKSEIANFHPAFRSILLDFDCFATNPIALKTAVERALQGFAKIDSPASRTVTIPVLYDGADLLEVAQICGLSVAELIELHASAIYTVAFLGFAPGFPYLLGLPERIRVPRLTSPRTRVPAGSVAIAGDMCGIYPLESPGGWRLLGRTNAALQLEVGDQVRFEIRDDLKFEGMRDDRDRFGVEECMRITSDSRLFTFQRPAQKGETHLGISPGGPADSKAFAEANYLVCNERNLEAIEFVSGESEIVFLRDTWFALTGAACEPHLDQMPIVMWRSLPVSAGQVLKIKRSRSNFRTYLAVHLDESRPEFRSSKSDTVAEYAGDQRILRVTRGPQENWFEPNSINRFFSCDFEVTTELSRRGIRLQGSSIRYGQDRVGVEMESEGISDGAIQIPPSGDPVILFCEQRTTGGYPKIANVVRADLHKIGQLRPGQMVRFQEIKMEDAWALST